MQSVLVIGIPSEPPVALAVAALQRLGVPHVVLNQRAFADVRAALRLADGSIDGVLSVDGQDLALEAFGGVYTRAVDHRLLPELEGVDDAAALRLHADLLNEILDAYCALTDARVVNRIAPGMSNASKPYQLQLIARRFAVPETLVTTDRDAVLELVERHGRVVYKSVSGCRSIVHELMPEDIERLDRLELCPTQFQQRVEGTDLRVHTLADGTVLATLIESSADDWRYAAGGVAMRAWEPDADVAERCLALAVDLGLDFAGIDLRLTPDGEAVCFEVNPSPAYSAFEDATGQPIAAALARYLAGV